MVGRICGNILCLVALFLVMSAFASSAAWCEGVSAISVGRLGSFGYRPEPAGEDRIAAIPLGLDEDVFAFNHFTIYAFPTYGLNERAIFFGHGGFYGAGDQETSHWLGGISWDEDDWRVVDRHWKVNWTTLDLTTTYADEMGASRSFRLLTSTAWPSMRLETESHSLRLTLPRMPTQWGDRGDAPVNDCEMEFFGAVATAAKCVPLLANETTILARPEEMTRNWVLLWQGGSPAAPEAMPVLLTFHRKPDRIVYRAGSDPSIEIDRRDGIGAINIMPLFGADVSADDDHTPSHHWLAHWRDSVNRTRLETPPAELPETVRDRVRFWSRALLAFPVACREEYTVAEDLKTVAVRDHWGYEAPPNEWRTRPVYLEPVPPAVVLAAKCAYPAHLPSRAKDLKLVTYNGPFWATIGEAAPYRLPIPAWGEYMPVNVLREENDALRRRLSDWGMEWQPHDDATSSGQATTIFRHLGAWPLLSDEAREHAAQVAAADLDRMLVHPKFRSWKDPNVGTEYLNAVGFEAEWTAGLALNALGFYGAYTGNLETINRYWPFIDRVFSYYRLASDWPTGAYSSDPEARFPRSECDPLTAGYEGPAAYAALAAQTGRTEQRDEALYILAKVAVPVFSRLLYMDHPEEFWRWTSDLCWIYEPEASILAGFHPYGPRPISYANNWAWGMMFTTYPGTTNVLSGFRRFNRRPFDYLYLEALPKYYPEWDQHPWKRPTTNEPPWGYDLPLTNLAFLGARSSKELLATLDRVGGKVYPLTYATAASSGVGVWPMIRDRYFLRRADWDPATSTLTLDIDGWEPSRPATVGIRTEQQPVRVLVNGIPAEGTLWDAASFELRVICSTPAKIVATFPQ